MCVLWFFEYVCLPKQVHLLYSYAFHIMWFIEKELTEHDRYTQASGNIWISSKHIHIHTLTNKRAKQDTIERNMNCSHTAHKSIKWIMDFLIQWLLKLLLVFSSLKCQVNNHSLWYTHKCGKWMRQKVLILLIEQMKQGLNDSNSEWKADKNWCLTKLQMACDLIVARKIQYILIGYHQRRRRRRRQQRRQYYYGEIIFVFDIHRCTF